MKRRGIMLLLPALLIARLAAAPASAAGPPDVGDVGSEAPGFALAAPDGTTYRLEDLRGGKDLVLIFFRGTW